MCKHRESFRIEVAGLIQELQPFIRSQVPRVLSRDEIRIMMKIADKGCFNLYYDKNDACISIAVSPS